MERVKLWAEAAANDLLDANHLADVACKMKKLGDSKAADEFADRARTHLGYVRYAHDEISKIISKHSQSSDELENKTQAMRIAAYEEEAGIGISIVESRLSFL